MQRPLQTATPLWLKSAPTKNPPHSVQGDISQTNGKRSPPPISLLTSDPFIRFFCPPDCKAQPSFWSPVIGNNIYADVSNSRPYSLLNRCRVTPGQSLQLCSEKDLLQVRGRLHFCSAGTVTGTEVNMAHGGSEKCGKPDGAWNI